MTKFFETLHKSGENLDGVTLPFSDEEIDSSPAPLCVERCIELPHKNGQPSLKSHCRTTSIRIPQDAPVLPFDGTHILAAERYRIIRTKIVQHPAAPQVICVSSTTPGDGKTINALNVASSLALKKDTTVVLLDVDLRRPQLAPLLGLSESPGLAEYLAGSCTIEEVLVRIAEMPSLYFIPSGRSPRNPTDLLDSSRWRALIDLLRKQFNFVVIDSPPIGVVADYDLIQTVADGIIMVVRPGHTKRKLLYKGIDQIAKERLLGIIINCVEDWFLWRTHDTSYYAYIQDRGSQR